VKAFRIPHGLQPILIVNGLQVDPKSRGGWIIENERDLTVDQAAAVTRILLDELPALGPSWHSPVKPFIPTVGLTFFRGERSVDAFLDVRFKVCKVGSGSGVLDPVVDRLRVLFEESGVIEGMRSP
jgi:hypothetical protein